MEQEQSGYRRDQNKYRSLGELVRGLFFICFALFAFFAEKLGMGEFRLSPTAMNIFASVLMAYGLFRVYRGGKQLFFNKG
ncbi:hypothetical protein [Chitinophaga defluvii]|uniref:Uncharacterized protein n=1 Tax=Chitinophaga defluvii TaxID=3163343 RepID=A0ABV2TDN5_9BACT